MKKIIVPTDFSSEAENALDYAAMIAEMTSAEIKIVHILEDIPEGTSLAHIVEIKANAKKVEKLDKLVESYAKKRVKVSYTVKGGPVHKNIINITSKENPDLIVMGTKGSTGIKEILVGSNAEKIVRLSKVPVITVNGKCKVKDIRNAVFAFDMIHKDIPKHVNGLMDLFQKYFDTKIHVLYVNTPLHFHSTHNAEAEMLRFVKKNKLEDFTLNIYNDLTDSAGVDGFVKHRDADLIIVPTHPSRGLIPMLNHGVSGHVVNHSNLPVLTYHLK